MFRYRGFIALSAAVLIPCAALAAPKAGTVRYAAPASWVKPSPAPTDAETPSNAPFRFIYSDTQVHVSEQDIETYTAYRVRILKPEALPMGQIAIQWNPASGSATVHGVKLIRGDQAIDVLKGTRFQVIQREGALEQSMLTGKLTAVLQVPGLMVGDELQVALTVKDRDPTLGDHAFGLFQQPLQGMPGAFRLGLSWPASRMLSLQSSRDLPVAIPTSEGSERTVNYELRDPAGAIVNEGAPGRFNIRRLIEYSDFSDWADVSSRIWPLFKQSATLSPDSPLRGEVVRIKALSDDPVARAQAALRLVQDEIRYVYVGLNGGNYRPADADETWRRRFGDCKAKTAVLLAILRELGIDAEAVLVNTTGDDGLDGRLPSPGVFNHVLVRAKIGDRQYWLDGTRMGDRYLDVLPQPTFSWALPVRSEVATVEPVKSSPFGRPQFVGVLDLDATAGFNQPAKVSFLYVLRGDDAFSADSNLAGLSADDADQALRKYWRQQESWVEADAVSWRYDERNKTIALRMIGTAKLDWEGDDKDGHSLTLWGAGFAPPDTLRRPRGQDTSAPWLNDFPRFRCWATTVRLPKAGPKLTWTYYADPMNREIGGVTYLRKSGLRGGMVRTVMSRSVNLKEITAQQALAQTQAIPGFNNKMSSVYETSDASPSTSTNVALPFGDGVDWASDDNACIAQK